MSKITNWLDTHRENWGCDFLGVACNKADAGQPTEIHWRYVSGNLNQHYQKIRLKVGKGVAGIVWKTGREQRDDHLLEKPELLMEYPIVRLEKLQQAIGIPLLKEHKVVGVLLLGYREDTEVPEHMISEVYTSLAQLILLLEDQ